MNTMPVGLVRVYSDSFDAAEGNAERFQFPRGRSYQWIFRSKVVRLTIPPDQMISSDLPEDQVNSLVQIGRVRREENEELFQDGTLVRLEGEILPDGRPHGMLESNEL